MKRTANLLLVAVSGVGLAALGLPSPHATAAGSYGSSSSADGGVPELSGKRPVVAAGSYQPAGSGKDALTYDEELVPVGARAKVISTPTVLTGTLTVFAVSGLVPNRHYGAHVHAKACGPTGADAGPHFQNIPDPTQPSTDPAYANPTNEIWLDFTTDALGNGQAISQVPWSFEDRRAGSVVIHEHHTHTGPDDSGTAGDRLSCLTVPF